MWLPSAVERAYGQVREDLAADPYLKYILALSFLLSTFWLWHRLPNFATRDERWRVVDAMEVAGFVADNGFSLESLQEGTAYWRPFGPTLYLYGLVALPAILLTVLFGQSGVFADLLGALGVDFYAHWQAIPAWLWWATVLPARLVNALLSVGCVYLLYRIGTTLRDRATGRLAALLLALTWAVIVLAHEAGEDVPALFCLLLVFYLAVRYVETGSRATFLKGCAIGGLAIAFKPTAGITAAFLGAAYVLHVRRSPEPLRALARPTLLLGGPILAVAVIYLAYPSTVLNGPELLQQRIDRLATEKNYSHGWLARPAWWWFLRGTLNGLGWPLTIASVAGIAAATVHLLRSAVAGFSPELSRLRERFRSDGGRPGAARYSLETDGIAIALSGLAVIGGVFSTWAYFRTHHLLPMFPLAILLLALAFQWLDADRSDLARGLAALLVVSTAIYAGAGTVGYAVDSRDQAVDYLVDNGGPNATVETYSEDSQEAAVPHGWTIYRPTDGTNGQDLGTWMSNVERRCPDYIVLNYQRAMLWLAPDGHSQLADRWAQPGAENVLRDFLSTEGPYNTANAPYPYEVAGEFGPRPPFMDGENETFDRTWNAVRAGIFPRTIQYGDPQDFGVYGYAVVLERTGSCEVGA